MKKSRLLGSTVFIAPMLVFLAGVNPTPAYANCVSTDGSAAVPDDGATVTCTGTSSVRVGDSTTSATVILEDDASLSTVSTAAVSLDNATIQMGVNSVLESLYGNAIEAQGVDLTLSDGAQLGSAYALIIDADGNVQIDGAANDVTMTGDGLVSSRSLLSVELGDNALLNAGGYGFYASNAISSFTAGDDFSLTTGMYAFGAFGFSDSSFTFGDGATITAEDDDGFRAHSGLTLTAGDDFTLTADGHAVMSEVGTVVINLGNNANITATNGHGIYGKYIQLTAGDDFTLTASAHGITNKYGHPYYEHGSSMVIDLGDNATITAGSDVGESGIRAFEDLTFTAGDGLTITAESGNAIFVGGESVIEIGNDATLTGGSDYEAALYLEGQATVTIGNNATINGYNAITAREGLTLVIGDGFNSETEAEVIYVAEDGDITIGANSVFSSSGTDAIDVSGNGTIDIGANTSLGTLTSDGIDVGGVATIILREGVTITAGDNALELGHAASVTLHDGVTLNASGNGIRVYSEGPETPGIITLMEDVSIIADERGIRSGSPIVVSMGAGSSIFAVEEGIVGVTELTMVAETSVTSEEETAIIATEADDTLDISGVVTAGGQKAFELLGGDDTLTLRTGADVQGAIDGGEGNDTLVLHGGGMLTGDIINMETLDMSGTLWRLSGDSQIESVSVNQGVLINNGSLLGSVSVLSDGIFGGYGSVNGSLTVNGGIVAPGDGVGTMSVSNDFTMDADSTLEIEVDVDDADLLAVGGMAMLAGNLQLVELSDQISAASVYTILTADMGIQGRFDEVLDNFTFLRPILTYGKNGVVLSFSADQLDVPHKTKNKSGSAVARELDELFAKDPGALADVQAVLNNLTPDQTADVLASQTGLIKMASVAAGVQAVNFNTQAAMARTGGAAAAQTASVEAPLTGMAAGNGYADPATVWLQVTGGKGDVDSDSNANGTKYRSWGTAFGVEKDKEQGLFGLFGGFSRSTSEFKSSAIRDKGYTDVYQLGLYGNRENGPWNLRGSLSGAYLDFETKRPTALGTARADFKGGGVFADVEASYDFALGDAWTFAPLLGVEGNYIRHQSYRESGAGGFNLSVDSNSSKNLATVAGVRLHRTYDFSASSVTPTLELGWAHEFLDQSNDAKVSFVSAPSVSYNTQGPDRDRDSLRVGFTLSFAGAEKGESGVSGYAGYKGDFAGNAEDHAGTVGVRFRW